MLPVPAPPNNNIAPNGPLNVLLNGTAQVPYLQQYNAQVQHEFWDGIMLGVAYQGEVGRHLPFSYQFNQGLPGTGLLGLPLIGNLRTASTIAYDNGVTSNYNSLQVNLSKRMGHGLQFQGAYTWSRALGYTTENNFLLNPFNRAANYGPAQFDQTNLLTIAHVFDVPLGYGTNHMNSGWAGRLLANWEVNGIFTWASGTPFTVFADPLFWGGPNGTVLANVNGPVVSTGLQGPFTPSFNTSAFAPPPPGTFSNQGRGFLRGPGLQLQSLPLQDLQVRGSLQGRASGRSIQHNERSALRKPASESER